MDLQAGRPGEYLMAAEGAGGMLDIVVPVYNEEKGILRLLDEIQREIHAPKRVLLVYDFEGDTTLPVVRECRGRYPFGIVLVKNRLGRGALNAIVTGMRCATAGMVLVVMADSSDRLDVVDKMCACMGQGYDLVCGSRYMKGGRQQGAPFLKGLLSRLAGVSLHLLAGIPTHDCTNSFKLYRRSMLEQVEIESTGGFEIGLEITVKAYVRGYRIAEVPSEWQEREDGESNFHMWKWLPHYLHWYFYCIRKKWLVGIWEHRKRVAWRLGIGKIYFGKGRMHMQGKAGNADLKMKKRYDNRFGRDEKKRKDAVWEEVCIYLRRFLKGGGKNSKCIVDVAAGYCGFINHIHGNFRKYALDVNPDVRKYAGKDVEALVGQVEHLGRYFGEGTVSIFFMSNFLEHLPKESISRLLALEYRLLEKGGQVWILTPNIRYVGGKYWDFYDHITPVTEKALVEEAEIIGYKVKTCIPKFLPFTTKSAYPQSRWIVRLYLRLMPLSGKIFGEQSFLILSKT